MVCPYALLMLDAASAGRHLCILQAAQLHMVAQQQLLLCMLVFIPTTDGTRSFDYAADRPGNRIRRHEGGVVSPVRAQVDPGCHAGQHASAAANMVLVDAGAMLRTNAFL